MYVQSDKESLATLAKEASSSTTVGVSLSSEAISFYVIQFIKVIVIIVTNLQNI